jgi:hypothetical protein
VIGPCFNAADTMALVFSCSLCPQYSPSLDPKDQHPTPTAGRENSPMVRISMDSPAMVPQVGGVEGGDDDARRIFFVGTHLGQNLQTSRCVKSMIFLYESCCMQALRIVVVCV